MTDDDKGKKEKVALVEELLDNCDAPIGEHLTEVPMEENEQK